VVLCPSFAWRAAAAACDLLSAALVELTFGDVIWRVLQAAESRTAEVEWLCKQLDVDKLAAERRAAEAEARVADCESRTRAAEVRQQCNSRSSVPILSCTVAC
jgi:hypothetical protein